MAKVIKYGDTSGIEGAPEQAPVGLYVLKCESIEQKNSQRTGDPQVEVVFSIAGDAEGKKLKKQYGRIWYYAPLDIEANWARRLKELVAAYGLKAKGGNLASIEGKTCLGRLREDTDQNGDYRPTIGKLLKLPDAMEPEDEEEDEEESEDGLADLSRADLKALIRDEGLEVKVLKSMTDDDLREAIEEAREEAEEEDEEEDEEEPEDDEEDEEDEDNYDSMSLADIKQELRDRELEDKGKKAVLIARLRTDDQEEPV